MNNPSPSAARRVWLRRLTPLLLGMLLAATFALWPDIQCAVFAQNCNARDQWCNGDCSQACVSATRLGYVASCSPVIIPGGSYCDDDFRANACAVRCSDAGNCNVTDLVSGGGCSGRLGASGSYSTWEVDRCPSYASNPSCQVQSRVRRVDCCTAGSGGGGGGGGGGCDPEYAAATLELTAMTPEYPLVLGQDPEEVGVDLLFTATAGEKTNDCDEGDDRQTITEFVIEEVRLSEETETWITGYLRQRYPGAQVLDTYPFVPDYVTERNGTTATLSVHLAPRDPGWYELELRTRQQDGQITRTTFQVPAYLLDATLSLP